MSFAYEDGFWIRNMWHSDDFIKYLKENQGSDVWDGIQKHMKDIVRWSLECVQVYLFKDA